MLLSCLALMIVSGAVRAAPNFHDPDQHTAIEKHVDVAIIGGGGSGAYAAARLRQDYNASVVVIEAAGRLGGHANTYVEPTTNTSINYGVQVYIDYGNARDFFARFNVEVGPPTFNAGPVNNIDIDIATGKELPAYEPPSRNATSNALSIWRDFSKQYESQMLPGFWNFFPSGAMPSELLLPFGDFVRQHNMEAAMPDMVATSNVGVGGIEKVMTLYVMGMAYGLPVAEGTLQGTFFQPVNAPNTLLYDRIYDLMKEDIMLNSRAIQAARNHDGVELLVHSNDGSEATIKAKRLLISAEPSLSNLRGLDLDERETALFSTFTPTWLFTSIVKTSLLPTNTSFNFITAASVPDNYLAIRDYPYTISEFNSVGPPDAHLFHIILSTNYTETHAGAQATIRATIKQLLDQGTVSADNPYTDDAVEFVAFADHNSVLWRQPAAELNAGLMQDVYALQGRRSTWWTGGLWCEDYSSTVWAFTDTVLPRMMEGLA